MQQDDKRDTGVYESAVSTPTTPEELQAWSEERIEELSQPIDFAAMLDYFKTSARRVFEAGKLSGDPDKADEVAEVAVTTDAWEALVLVGLIERDWAAGRFDQAVGRAMFLGRLVERMAIRWSEPHSARGRKILDGAKDGHVKTHGDDKAKRERWGQHQTALNSVIKENPDIGIDAARRLAREKLKAAGQDVSLRTIMRHTRDPRKTP